MRPLFPLVGLLLVFGGFASAQAAEVRGIAPASRFIDPHMAGYNSDYYYVANPWSSPKRVAAAVKAAPGMLRYPGGTSASYWDPYHSRLFQDVTTINPADTDPAAWTQTQNTINWLHSAYFWQNPTPLSDWHTLYAALQKAQPGGAQNVFVANMVTPGPDFYALKWGRAVDNTPGSADWWAMLGIRYGALTYMLHDAAQSGLPVRYVELGNEYYFGAGLTHDTGPADVEPYVAGGYNAGHGYAFDNVGTFPDKGANGTDALYLYGVAANDWAAKIKKLYPTVKVCAVGAFLDKGGYGPRTANWNTDALAALDPAKLDALSLHIYGGPQTGSLIGTEAQFGAAVASWQQFWLAGVARSHLPPREDFWVTEFNIQNEFDPKSPLPPSKGTWGNGLGNVACLNYWLAHAPRVKVALLHELARVIVGDGPDIRAEARAYGLFASALTGHTRARSLVMGGVPFLLGSGGTLPGVVGWAFDAPGASAPVTYAFVNFTGSVQPLSGLARLPGVKGAVYTQAAAPLATLTDPGTVVGTVARLRTLPPYSVTVMRGAGTQKAQ